jgi:hypothetical protein
VPVDLGPDPAVSPADYPGVPAPHSGLLAHGRFGPVPVSALDDYLRTRALVVAVGSNASPAVVHRKLARCGASDEVAFLTGTVTGLAVGHSAHVSVPGFVPAAPFHDPRAATDVRALLLNEKQLSCLDATEPNYTRRAVPATTCRLQLDGGRAADVFWVYDGRWGVLAPPDAAPWPLTTQAQLHARLRAHWPPYEQLVVNSTSIPQLLRALARDARLRGRIRDAWHAEGWARDSGLAD